MKDWINKRISVIFYVYLIGLFIAHVMKTGGEIDLNNYFWGIRADHWIHATMFIPMGIFVFILFQKNRWLPFLFGFVACFFFESLQYYLPYRSFDLTDIMADACGVSIGMILWFMFFQKVRRAKI